MTRRPAPRKAAKARKRKARTWTRWAYFDETGTPKYFYDSRPRTSEWARCWQSDGQRLARVRIQEIPRV